MSLTQTYRAVNCDRDNYGVTNRTYGWTPTPCKVRHCLCLCAQAAAFWNMSMCVFVSLCAASCMQHGVFEAQTCQHSRTLAS
jgi:hypothetical protein